MAEKTPEEIARGCLSRSKIYPYANEIRDRYLAGETISRIAEDYRQHGITAASVSGYITKNKFKRSTVVEAAAAMRKKQADRKQLQDLLAA